MAFGASALAILGERERAKEWMERALLVEPENDLMRYNFACAPSAHLGDVDGAIALLGPVFDNISMNLMNGARTDPDLDPLRGDPRFQAMLAAAEARFAGQASPATPPA